MPNGMENGKRDQEKYIIIIDKNVLVSPNFSRFVGRIIFLCNQKKYIDKNFV
jgi:hypothetical protein